MNHLNLSFNLSTSKIKTHERTFQDKEWNLSTMFFATHVRKDTVFNTLLEKKNASFDKY